jgi:hypothetical protein
MLRCSTIAGPAAYLSGERGAVGSSEEHKACGNFAGLRRPANGCSELLDGLLIHRGWDERCPYRAGRDGVNADALGDDLVGQATREGNNGALGRCVVEQVGAANVGVNRGVVEDGCARLHVGQGVLGQVEEWVNVGVEGVYPLVPGPC